MYLRHVSSVGEGLYSSTVAQIRLHSHHLFGNRVGPHGGGSRAQLRGRDFLE